MYNSTNVISIIVATPQNLFTAKADIFINFFSQSLSEHLLASVNIKGELHKRVKKGKRVYRGFFVIMVDGKIKMNLGTRNANGGYDGNREITFARTLSIVGKSGPSGLEGSKPDGGKWVIVHLVPSQRLRRIAIQLPILEGEKIKLEISGFFDISGFELCSNCEYSEVLQLEPFLNA